MRANLNRALFGSDTPSKFVRPRLGEELVKVRTWPTVLAGAPLAKLVADDLEQRLQVAAGAGRGVDQTARLGEREASAVASAGVAT